jgi:hypothetical protein
MEALGRWRSFLDSLDTGGGHIFVLIVLIAGGSGLFFFDATAGGQIITGAFGALLMMLKIVGSNRDQLTGPPALTATVTTAPAPPTPPTDPPQGEPK